MSPELCAVLIVYQMGKVASMAISEELKRRGLDVRHSHMLGREQILHHMNGVLSPAPENPLTQNLDGLFYNIRTTHEILRHKRDGRKLKFITAVRNPMDWWVSNFIHKFEVNRHRIASCLSENDLPSGCTSELVSGLLELVAARLASVEAAFDDDEFHREIGPSNGLRHYHVIRSQLRDIIRPLTWLDTHLAPVTGVNVYDVPFNGHFHLYGNGSCEVLLLRFEEIAQLRHEIGRFAGLVDFRLPRRNATRDKPAAGEIRDIWRKMAWPQNVMEKTQATRYCRHFGYSVA